MLLLIQLIFIRSTQPEWMEKQGHDPPMRGQNGSPKPHDIGLCMDWLG